MVDNYYYMKCLQNEIQDVSGGNMAARRFADNVQKILLLIEKENITHSDRALRHALMLKTELDSFVEYMHMFPNQVNKNLQATIVNLLNKTNAIINSIHAKN